MFFFLSKFLPLFVYPAGLAVICLVIALALRKRRKWHVTLVVTALVVLYLGGNRLVGMALVRSLEWRIPPLPQSTQNPFDAIVVLGGGTQQGLPPRPTHEIGEAGDRLLYAASLYSAGRAPTVIVSGGRSPLSTPGPASESEVMADLLARLGVPREAITIEGTSRNTYENSVETSKLLRERQLDRVLLVTSAMHMPRALGVFTRQGIHATPAPTDYLVTQPDWIYFTRPTLAVALMDLVPKAEYMALTEKALKEYLGIIVYRMRGWI
jgi:uncharacterized SAM-binding protein YcdF (DUF218 family)